MIRKFKHIIAILLLVTFPLSAIGLSISVHKCKHKGTIHFSFFGISNSNSCCCCSKSNNNHSVNCVEHNSTNSDTKTTINDDLKHSDMDCVKNSAMPGMYHHSMSGTDNHKISICQEENQKKDNAQANKLKVSVQKTDVGSCAMGEESHKNDNTLNGELSNIQKSLSPGIQRFNTPCCTKANLSYIIKSAYVSLSKSSQINFQPIIIYVLYHFKNVEFRINNEHLIRNIQYPLKGPICCIISFIHSTSIYGYDTEITDSFIPC